MAIGDIINVEVIEVEPIAAEVVELESISVEMVEVEPISVEVAAVEVVSADVSAEGITVEQVVEESIVVQVESFCNPCGGSRGSSGAGQVFILNVTNSGITADKVYTVGTVPPNTVLESVVSDTESVTIHFLAEGGTGYSPTVSIDGVECTNLQQYVDDRRIFYGSVTVNVSESRTVPVTSSSGATTGVLVNRAGAGPAILSCVIGAYPGTQTAAKSGDSIQVTGTVDDTATHIRLLGVGAFYSGSWVACSGGTWTVTGGVSNLSGLQRCRVEARNAIGTVGDPYDSGNEISLDQVAPSFTDNGTTFPAGQLAFKDNEEGLQNTEVHSYSHVTYSSPHGDFSISTPSSYDQVKAITCTAPGDYNDSSTNFRIQAHKAANDTNATFNKTIEVADVAPVLTISQPAARLRSSPLGTNHSILAQCNQNLDMNLNISIPVGGAWAGSWSGSAKMQSRSLRVQDSDAKGSALWAFNGPAPKNNAGLDATITGTQVNGGFYPRNLVLEAFNNEISVAVAVADYSKVRLGYWEFTGSGLTRSSTINDNPPPVPGYFTIDQEGADPHIFRNLDTNQTNSSSQATLIYNYEEVV